MPRTDVSMYFTHVAVLTPDRVVLAGHLYSQDEDERVSRLVVFDHGEWSQLADLPEIVAALRTVEQAGTRACAALLRNGVTHYWRSDDDHSVEIIDPHRGLFFNDLKQIDGTLYACGTGRQVFRNGAGRWGAVDDELFVEPSKPPAPILTGIDGVSESDIFASGTRGEIWHYDGRHWQSVESPTNVGFTCVLCTAGMSYHCGAHGVLCRGNLDGWRLLPGANPDLRLTDIAPFQDQIYACSEFELLTIDGENVVPVQTGIGGELGFGALASGGGQLWSVGGETILRFDGTRWMKFEFPWN